MRTKKAAEGFIGERIEYIFMDKAQYVFKRSIAAHLVSCYSPLNIPRHEFVIYGWFAHKFHRDEYNFIRSDEDESGSIVGLVNQIPPNYLRLDSACNYEQFRKYKYVVFWSNWDLTEEKMIEFFEESQRAHFGYVVYRADRNSLTCIVDPNDIKKGNFRYFEGVFMDGWVKRVLKFMITLPDDWQSAVMEFTIPKNPSDSNWKLTGEMLIGSTMIKQPFSLMPGLKKLLIKIPKSEKGMALKIELHFGQGFFYAGNPDRREFRARLIAIRKQGL